MKNFKLTSESKINFLGKKLFRIECTVDFKYAKKGDKGGWVEKEDNISGNAWVYGDAEVYGNAKVYGNAEVSGNAKSTKKVFTLNFIYSMTVTDNHIKYGCEQRTFEEWEKYLNSNEVIETDRNTEKFKIIEMALRLAIENNKL